MSDETELNGMDMEPAAPAEAPVPAEPKTSSGDFLSTTAGKVVLLAVAVLVLLVIAGAVGWFVLGPATLGGTTGTPGEPTVVAPAPPASPGTGAPAPSAVASLPVAVVSLRDAFTPRNPFVALKSDAIPQKKTSAAAADDDTDDTPSAPDPNVVTVTAISGGTATIAYGGTSYTVGPGQSFGGNATWTVVAVHASSVDVLMGGDSVNLPLSSK